jgi:hypothetical protein
MERLGEIQGFQGNFHQWRRGLSWWSGSRGETTSPTTTDRPLQRLLGPSNPCGVPPTTAGPSNFCWPLQPLLAPSTPAVPFNPYWTLQPLLAPPTHAGPSNSCWPLQPLLDPSTPASITSSFGKQN